MLKIMSLLTKPDEWPDLLSMYDQEHLQIPPHRRPLGRDIFNLFPSIRRRQLLAKNCYEAVGIIAARNPDRVIQYV